MTVAELAQSLAGAQEPRATLVARALAGAKAAEALNIFTSLDENAVTLAAAARRGGPPRPLEGIPIAVKDNLAVAGQPFSGGSRAIGTARAVADAGAVARLRDAGAVVIGKTNLHEFAFGVTSNNAAYGAVENPSVPGHSAGGSSGGAAAAVAAGIVPISLGTDTGGSGRIPAAFCGCVGFRPSTARYPGSGVLQLTWTLDTVATFAKHVADIRLLDNIICGAVAGQTPPDPARLCLGVPRDSFVADLDGPVARAFDKALGVLDRAGVRLIPIDLAEVLSLDRQAARPIALFEAAAIWRRELARRGIAENRFIRGIASPDVKAIFDQLLNDGVSTSDYALAMNEGLRPIRHIYGRVFAGGIDALVFPTVPVPPPPLGENDTVCVNGAGRPLFPTIVRNTSPGTLAAIPGISLPFGTMDGGMPFGLEIDGAAGTDTRLLAMAETIEKLALGAGV